MTKNDTVGAIAEISVTMTVEEWTTIMARIANRTMSPTGARIYKRAAARMCDQIAHGAEAVKASGAPLHPVLADPPKPKVIRRTAAEIIAFHFGMDIADVQDGRYQPTRFANPAVYVVGDDYYCAPSSGQAPVGQFADWSLIGEEYGRPIYMSKGTE